MLHAPKSIVLLILTAISFPSATTAHANNRDRTIQVVTYNMYLGAEFSDIFQAQSQADLVSEVAEAYSDMLAGNVPERVAAIADQIEISDPVLVGLQEVALWRTGPAFDPASAETVSIDHLQLLLGALEARGLHYAPIAVQTNLDAELPGVFGPTSALDIRFTDRVVILARTDLHVSEFKLEAEQTGTFAALLPISSPVVGTITIPRGWASADVKLRGKGYRFITTHLESFYEPVQLAQAQELLQGPATTNRRVILTGDLNSDAAASGAAYQMITASGFTDAWSSRHPRSAGFTWPLSAESPSAITCPTQRLDLIMTRGALGVSRSIILGEDPIHDVTPSGLRPSDHAGLAVTLAIQNR